LTFSQPNIVGDKDHQWITFKFFTDEAVVGYGGGFPTGGAVLVNFVAERELRNVELFFTARTFFLGEDLLHFGDPRFLNVLVGSTGFDRGTVKELVRVVLVAVTV
jgi:hypothetical protein